MKRISKFTNVMLLLFSLGSLKYVVALQAGDLEPAAVKITNAVTGKGGTGFVFRHDDKEHATYILTCEHVVRGSKTVKLDFFAQPNKTVLGSVVRGDRGKDLAVVKVSSESDVSSDVMIMALGQSVLLRPGDPLEIVDYSFTNDLWSVLKGNVEAVRDEVVDEGGQESVHVIRFSADIKQGDSGSPLLLNDQVVGIVESGAPSDGDVASSRAISLSTIQDFLKDLLPDPDPVPPSWVHHRSVPAPLRPVENEAKLCATTFLDLLIENRLSQAYKSLADITRRRFSEAAFVDTYNRFALGTKGGLIERQLDEGQEMVSPPGAPEITTGTYVLTFESRYQAYPTVKVFETVTVIKDDRKWKVMSFYWNAQPVDQSAR
jgi:hypothetical protein